jgi:hypothetical protein
MKNIQSTIFKGYDQQTAGPFQAWHFFRRQKKLMMSTNFTSFVNTVKTFFDLKSAPVARCSRIRRRNNKTFEEFIFKGYDQQTPGLSRPGSFNDLKMIWKN